MLLIDSLTCSNLWQELEKKGDEEKSDEEKEKEKDKEGEEEEEAAANEQEEYDEEEHEEVLVPFLALTKQTLFVRGKYGDRNDDWNHVYQQSC